MFKEVLQVSCLKDLSLDNFRVSKTSSFCSLKFPIKKKFFFSSFNSSTLFPAMNLPKLAIGIVLLSNLNMSTLKGIYNMLEAEEMLIFFFWLLRKLEKNDHILFSLVVFLYLFFPKDASFFCAVITVNVATFPFFHLSSRSSVSFFKWFH